MARYLVQLSDAAFADIPSKVVPRTIRLRDPALQSGEAAGWILSGYYEKLLGKNEDLQNLLARFAGKFDDPECRAQLTQGQRILHVLTALDGEVKNGGLAQFFWNCPDLIFEVPEALTVLAPTALTQAYDQALAGLVRNKDDWVELRKRASSDSATFWEPFQRSYELLELGWFDVGYLETHGPAMVARLVEYVKLNKAEFIEP